MCANPHALMSMWKPELLLLLRTILGSFFFLPYSKGRVSQTQSLLIWLIWLASSFWRSWSLFSEAGIKRRPPFLPAFMLASMNLKCGLHTLVASTLTTEPFPQPHDKVFASNLLLMAVSVWGLFLFLQYCCDLKISSYACHLCFHQ